MGFACLAVTLANIKARQLDLVTITVSTDQFPVNPTDIVLHGTTINPGPSAMLIDNQGSNFLQRYLNYTQFGGLNNPLYALQTFLGQSVSAESANDLFVDRTQILTGPPVATITVSTDTYVVNPTNIVIDGLPVLPGGPRVTLHGTVFSEYTSSNLFANGTKILAGPTTKTITIGTTTYAVNPTNIIIDGNIVKPGAPPLTLNGAAISEGTSSILFADGTKILAGPTPSLSHSITSGPVFVTPTTTLNPSGPYRNKSLVSEVQSVETKAAGLLNSLRGGDTTAPACSGGGPLGLLDALSCAFKGLSDIEAGLIASTPDVAAIEAQMGNLGAMAQGPQNPEDSEQANTTDTKDSTTKTSKTTSSTSSSSSSTSIIDTDNVYCYPTMVQGDPASQIMAVNASALVLSLDE
ncbi:hypothetical protein OEA41_009318 [Lepraria neglecta]|uniref:Uncharacterized protein n=1 Tax=Lepraria neglecta TaxID=209136 RepID=A0AAD9Z1E8_9LECA|nr:hypothetical protein OEA41_009318 [Lepraria neglecta]